MHQALWNESKSFWQPYLKSKCINQVWPQLEIRKIVELVVYKFAHGISHDHITKCFKSGGPTTRKYTYIVCDILINRQKLFRQCINILNGAQLENIISNFKALAELPNVTNAIDGTHIPLADHPNHRITLVVGDFFNMKKIHLIVLQGV